MEGKKYRNLTVYQDDGGFTCKGNNTLFISNFKDFPETDMETIRIIHKYLTSINKVNTLKVLFAMFKLVLKNNTRKSYAMSELVEKTGLSENDIWLAFNDLNIKVEYQDDGTELWYLGCVNEVQMLISLLIPHLMDWNPNEKNKSI